LVKKFRHHFSLAALLMVVVLLAGCIGGETAKEEYTLNITVKLAEGGEGKVEDVSLNVGDKAIKVGTDGKATATVAEGKVLVKATLDGYVSAEKTVTVPKDKEVTITLEVAKTEKQLVDAVNKAADGKAFLEALQELEEAGFVTGVIEDYKDLYFAQSKNYELFIQEVPPHMRTAVEIQQNVIDPVNTSVADAISAVNDAVGVSPGAVLTALKALQEAPFALLEGIVDESAKTYDELVDKYASNTIKDLQNIIDGAAVKAKVEALFGEPDEDGKPVLADDAANKIDNVKAAVADVKIAGLKSELEAKVAVAQGLIDDKVLDEAKTAIEGLFVDAKAKELELIAEPDIEGAQAKLDAYKGTKSTADLQALIDKAQDLLLVRNVNDAVDDATEMKTALDALDYTPYNNLKTLKNREEVAGRFVGEIGERQAIDEGFEFKTTDEVKAVLDSVIAEYEAIIAAVNNATTNDDTKKALVAIKEGVTIEEATSVLTQKPEGGYVTIAEIETAFGVEG